MPVVDTAYQHLLTARAIHKGQMQEGRAVFNTLDWSAIIAGTRVAAGLDGFDSQKVCNSSPQNGTTPELNNPTAFYCCPRRLIHSAPLSC
jgi:hypothetical protein